MSYDFSPIPCYIKGNNDVLSDIFDFFGENFIASLWGNGEVYCDFKNSYIKLSVSNCEIIKNPKCKGYFILGLTDILKNWKNEITIDFDV